MVAQDRGVLAIGDESGRHAFSFRGEADAVNMCGTTDCKVVAIFEACLGVAYSRPTLERAGNLRIVGQGPPVWMWAEAVEEGVARVAALEECQSAGGTACEVLNVYCVDVPAEEPDGPVAEEGLGLDRAARRQIQLGLQTAGFDPGGADGLFGPRTRAAIRRWQAAGNVSPTGYLTAVQLQTLRDGGSSPGSPTVAGSRQVAPEPPAVAEVSEPEVPEPDPEPVSLAFRPDQTCADLPGQDSSFGAACWMEVSQQPGCYVWSWSPYLSRSASGTWTGECAGGLAQGTGTLTWSWDDSGGDRWSSGTGQLQNGKQTAHWVGRFDDGGSEEGPYVDGKRHGHWVFRYASGRSAEGPYVDGEQHGRWDGRDEDGRNSEPVFYENGRFIRRVPQE